MEEMPLLNGLTAFGLLMVGFGNSLECCFRFVYPSWAVRVGRVDGVLMSIGQHLSHAGGIFRAKAVL